MSLNDRTQRFIDRLTAMFTPALVTGGLEEMLVPLSDGSGCPVLDCRSCQLAQIARVVSYEDEINAVAWWLTENLPEIWYAEHPIRVRKMAAALVQLRRGVDAGTWGP